MFLNRSLFFVLFALAMRENRAKQSCNESLLNKNGKFSKADIKDLISIENQAQIKMCLTVLGKNQLEARIAELLWRDLVKVRKKLQR